jgi:hypothetical protein
MFNLILAIPKILPLRFSQNMITSESPASAQAQLKCYMQDELMLMQLRNIPKNPYTYSITQHLRATTHTTQLCPLDPYSPIACEKRLAKLSKRYG